MLLLLHNKQQLSNLYKLEEVKKMTETDLGTIVTLSTAQRNPEMEERFQIFP